VLAKIRNDALRKARKQVEEAFEKYRIYLFTLPEEHLPKITPSYSIIPPTKNNQFHSTTEDIAIKHVDFERERDEYLSIIQKAVNKCTEEERSILIKRYLEDEEIFDYQVFNELGLSESVYYKKKKKVLEKLAIILGILKMDEYKKSIVN
jgi:ArpU family phage transcriptional regulator